MGDPIYGAILMGITVLIINFLIKIHSFGNNYKIKSSRETLWSEDRVANSIYEIEQMKRPSFLLRSYYVFSANVDLWFTVGTPFTVILITICISIAASKKALAGHIPYSEEIFPLLQVTGLCFLVVWLFVCLMKYRKEKNRFCELEIHIDKK